MPIHGSTPSHPTPYGSTGPSRSALEAHGVYYPPDAREVVKREADVRRAMIGRIVREDEARVMGRQQAMEYALQPAPIINMPTIRPTEIVGTTIIPLEVAEPTVGLTGVFGDGEGTPWTAQLVSLTAAVQAIGQILISVAGELVLSLAVTKMEEGIDAVKKRRYNEFASVRFHTGKGFAKHGKAVGPRGAGGEVPSGNTPYPYDEQDGWSWFNPWTWF